ncbi:hypothetical protein [Mesorhizobium sp. Cs1299R1N3]|uniref:hypothetical protein n=1 Tax=Mesorhizobium sp. Cs1299R1N3 TaxID=3015173 RepID=UPI00301C1A06
MTEDRKKPDLNVIDFPKTLRDRPPAGNIPLGTPGVDHDRPDKPEAEHFIVCTICGQMIDMRKLDEVLHHADIVHDPLPPSR